MAKSESIYRGQGQAITVFVSSRTAPSSSFFFWKDYCVTRQKLLQGRLGQALLPWKILNVLSSILRDIKSLIRSEH